MNSRELVYKTLAFQNKGRVPRQLWTLPWARMYEGEKLEVIQQTYPDDIIWDMPVPYKTEPKRIGDPYEEGQYVDEWGCVFTSIQRGIVGEIKDPIVVGEDWEDVDKVHFPEELLSLDVEKVNEFCRNTDKFVLQTDFARVFERLQFIRGTENLFLDIALENEGMLKFLEKLHDFNCRKMEAWAQTEVDALFMMDDWGSQNTLLINPETWTKLFKPLYADYCAIARKYGKKIFMHSDGNTAAIIPELIEIGVDAVNLQIFCIGLEELRKYKGKITFWGEIDRQWILPNHTVGQVEEAVKQVYDTLWADGGCIGQCEFGPGAKPENVNQVFATWSQLRK